MLETVQWKLMVPRGRVVHNSSFQAQRFNFVCHVSKCNYSTAKTLPNLNLFDWPCVCNEIVLLMEMINDCTLLLSVMSRLLLDFNNSAS